MRTLASLVMVAALTGPALADCPAFTLLSDGSQRHVAYLATNNLAIGERRIGTRALLREGAPAGTHEWINATPPAQDNGFNDQSGIFTLAEGTIHYTAYWQREMPASHTETAGGTGYTATITGGTGAYEDARGTITTRFSGNAAHYDIALACS